MKVTINHKEAEVAEGATLADVLAQHGLDGPGYASAIGMKVVRRDERATRVVQEGDDIIVIKAVCGG